MAGRASKKHGILHAAAEVVEEQGAAHLTLDAVAAKAGVSKGGLLYHFPTKQALIRGMLDRVIEGQQQRTEAAQTGGPKAHVLAVVAPLPKEERSFALAVLAAAAEDPDLLSGARDFMRGVLDDLKGTPHFAQALMVIIAAEGLRIMDTLNLLPLTPDEHKQLINQLVTAAEGTTS